MRRILTLAAVLALAAGATVLPSVGARAAILYELDVELVSNVEPLTFAATVYDDSDLAVQAPLCESVELLSVEANGSPVTPLSQSANGSDTVTFTLPSDTPPGNLSATVRCTDGEFETEVSGNDGWAALAVAKVVQGAVPDDAAFVVNVDCVGAVEPDAGEQGFDGPGVAGIPEPFAVDLSFGATGGTKYVYFGGPADCVITEPVDGGATATTIDPGEVFVEDPTGYATTVTNAFPAAVEPAFTG